MFVRLILKTSEDSVTIEKEFNSIKSLKDVYLSNKEAYNVSSVFLVEDFKGSSKISLSLENYEEHDRLVGLAYLCESFESVQDMLKYYDSKIFYPDYLPNEEKFLNQALKSLTPNQVLDSTRDYKRYDAFFYVDESKKLHSTNKIKHFSSFEFDDLYKGYFEEHTPEGVEWEGTIEILKNSEKIEVLQLNSKKLFFEDAYNEIKESINIYIDEHFKDKLSFITFYISLDFKC